MTIIMICMGVVEMAVEEARQHLLEDEESLLSPLPDHNPYSNDRQYGATVPRQPRPGPVQKPKRYRLPLLILMSFDTALVVFLSIICYLNNNTSYSFLEYTDLNIKTSVFDLVLMAVIRFVLLFLFYLILGWVNRIILTITTLASTIYVPLKAFFYWSNNLSNVGDIQYILVLLYHFASFVMPWFVAFFFEFKYLPAEMSRLSTTTWKNWRVWLCPWMLVKSAPPITDQRTRRNGGGRTSVVRIPPSVIPRYNSMDTVFRTPIGSNRDSPVMIENEDLIPIIEEGSLSPAECDQFSDENESYKQLANETLDKVLTLARSNNGWNLERHQDGIKIYSQQGSVRKIWKSQVTLDVSLENLWRLLYNESHRTPEWNPNVVSNEIIYRIDRTTDIIYTVSAAVALVSARDFVSVRKASVREGCYCCASISINFDGKPPVADKIRGENGPCGYVLLPVDLQRTLFIWLLDTDLKGWIPQSVIDQTFSSTLLTANSRLRTFLQSL